MNKIYIYLRGEEELGEIIDKIRKTKEKEIILVIPRNTTALLYPTNLEIFQKEINNLNKKVYFETEDEKLINLARHFKINIFLNEFEERPIVDIKPSKKKVEKVVFSKPQSRIKFKFKFGDFLKYLFSFLFIFLLSFLFWQIFQTRAEISIETEKTPLELNEVITFKEGTLKPDYENKVLPAEYVVLNLVKTETITTTGKIFTEEKPPLSVVFLNYLDQEIPLKDLTQLSFNNNIFRTTQRIIIPPRENNEPGKANVTALPFEIKDENLNLPAGTNLSIVKLEGKKTEDGRLWTDVLKARVENNYNLSQSIKVGSVTPEDITNVKLALENSLKSALRTELAFKYPQSFYHFDPTLIKIDITNISHNVGEKTDKISATGRASLELLISDKKEFSEFIKNLLNQEILNKKENLLIKDLNYEKIDLFDFDSKKKIMTLGVSVKANLIPDINPEALKEKIKGESLDMVKNYFTKFPGVKSVKIKIFPQWKENLPQNAKRIKIIVL